MEGTLPPPELGASTRASSGWEQMAGSGGGWARVAGRSSSPLAEGQERAPGRGWVGALPSVLSARQALPRAAARWGCGSWAGRRDDAAATPSPVSSSSS